MLLSASQKAAFTACAAILLVTAPATLAADACGDLLRQHASISLQIRAVESEYPQTARVYHQCSAYADKESDIGTALVKLLACAGSQCLVIGMETCDSVFKMLTQLERERDAVETRQRELSC